MVRLIMCGWYPEEIQQWTMKKKESSYSQSKEKETLKKKEGLTKCMKNLERQTE